MIGFVLRKLLVAFLSHYLEGLRDVSFSKNGTLKVEDVQLKVDALNDFMEGVPVRIKKGSIRKLSINIPMTNIVSAPIVLDVEGVHVVVRLPTIEEDTSFDKKKEEKAAKMLKQQQIKELERKCDQEEAAGLYPEEGRFHEKLLGRMIAMVVDSLQARVRNLNVQFDDEKGNMIGVVIPSIEISSTDQHWDDIFVSKRGFRDSASDLPKMTRRSVLKDSSRAGSVEKKGSLAWVPCGAVCGLDDGVSRPSQMFFKKITVFGLFVYIDLAKPPGSLEEPDKKPQDVGQKPKQSRKRAKFQTSPASSLNPNEHLVLLQPCNVRVLFDADMSARIPVDRPRFKGRIELSEVELNLHQEQIDVITAIVDGVTVSSTLYRHRYLRPKARVSKKTAQGWWKYAISSVIQDRNESKSQITWDKLFEYKRRREKYVPLWIKSLQGSCTKSDEAEIDEIESAMAPADIVFFRSVSRKTMKEKGLKVSSKFARRTSMAFGMSDVDFDEFTLEMQDSGPSNAEADSGDAGDNIRDTPTTVRLDVFVTNVSVKYSAVGTEVISAVVPSVTADVVVKDEIIKCNVGVQGDPSNLLMAGTNSELQRFLANFTQADGARAPLLTASIDVLLTGNDALQGRIVVAPLQLTQTRAPELDKIGAIRLATVARRLVTVSFHGIEKQFRVSSNMRFADLLSSACLHWSLALVHYELQDRDRCVWPPTASVITELCLQSNTGSEKVYLAERDSIRRTTLQLQKGQNLGCFEGKHLNSVKTTSRWISCDSEKLTIGWGPLRKAVLFSDIRSVLYGSASPTIIQKPMGKVKHHLCFTVTTVSGKNHDIQCHNEDQALSFVMGLQHLANCHSPEPVLCSTRAALIIQRAKMKIDSRAAAQGRTRADIISGALRDAAKSTKDKVSFSSKWAIGKSKKKLNLSKNASKESMSESDSNEVVDAGSIKALSQLTSKLNSPKQNPETAGAGVLIGAL